MLRSILAVVAGHVAIAGVVGTLGGGILGTIAMRNRTTGEPDSSRG